MKIIPKYFFLGMAITAIPTSIFVLINISSEPEVMGETIALEEQVELVETEPTSTPESTPIPTPEEKVTLSYDASISTYVTYEEVPSPTPIPTQTSKSEVDTSPPVDVFLLFDKYASQYGIGSNVLKVIADCESHFHTTSVNGPYGGMFQFHYSTWATIRAVMGEDPNPDLRFNAEESIKTAAFKISKDGTGAWPSCSVLLE